jgi:hypothetical protein
MKKQDYISLLQFDHNQRIHLLLIDDQPSGFILEREGYHYSVYELIKLALQKIIDKLNLVFEKIKQLDQNRPKKEKIKSSITNEELRAILANVPNERKEEIAKIFKNYQKSNALHIEIPEEELTSFGLDVLSKIDVFIENNNLRSLVNCFSLCGVRYDFLFKKDTEKTAFVKNRVKKSKSNFYGDLVNSFKIEDYCVNDHLDRAKIKIIPVSLILNKELFERELINRPFYTEE